MKVRPPERQGIRRGTVIFALVAVTAIGYYSKTRAQSHSGVAIAALPSVRVVSGAVNNTIRLTGTVSALNSAWLLAPRILGSRSGFNRGGDGGGAVQITGGGGGFGGDFSLVLLSLAKAGTHVNTGDVVGRFDPQFQLQRLDDYKDTVVQLDNNIQSMRSNLAAIKEAHDQSVRSAKAAWDKAILDLETAPVRSQIDVEDYKLAKEEAEATYKQLVFESSLVEESQQSQIKISEFNRNQAQIELQRAQSNVDKMTIKAPMSGVVVMANIVRNGEFGQIREGDNVNAGQPFMSIVDPSSMVLNAGVNQVDAQRLRLGMKATVHLDAYPDLDVPGTVTGIGAMTRPSAFRASYVGEIPVRIKIDRMDPRLIPDLTGSAEVMLQSESDALVVPRTAVFEENGGEYVFVRTPEGWTKEAVQLGLENNTVVAVHSGLHKGDAVALQHP